VIKLKERSCINRDDGRQDRSGLILGPGVKVLAEGHDVDPGRTKGGTHGRRRIGGSRGKLKFNRSCDFLCHRETIREAQKS
jgi:hypothetical protein